MHKGVTVGDNQVAGTNPLTLSWDGPLSTNHSGTYTCRAKNEVATVTSTFILTVRRKCVLRHSTMDSGQVVHCHFCSDCGNLSHCELAWCIVRRTFLELFRHFLMVRHCGWWGVGSHVIAHLIGSCTCLSICTPARTIPGSDVHVQLRILTKDCTKWVSDQVDLLAPLCNHLCPSADHLNACIW